ncbi:hypothetical protein ACFOLK_09675 [Marinococcus halophilus]|uniref:Spore coat protein n=1 Tax=Marinococcus halophilus TaxID=1371 RepID=A0A510Y497_MARHA|nr:hypothetical protein [Marinococcus halophilus]GEK58160.1 hypothetical protein MHA01_10650 [Marinococcus halophilus]
MADNYASHEIIEIHELLQVKAAATAKASMMQGLATDKQLKQLLEESAVTSQQAVQELRELLEQSK